MLLFCATWVRYATGRIGEDQPALGMAAGRKNEVGQMSVANKGFGAEKAVILEALATILESVPLAHQQTVPGSPPVCG